LGVYEDLLAWSAGRPIWQRDALRRLATLGPLGEQDISELTQLALAEAGGPATGLTAIPLAATHVPTVNGDNGVVNVLGISDIENVNSLASGARLTFAPVGITVVYGDNGSGKSGYIRVLKKVCRARATPEQVLPNLVSPDTRPTAATIDFSVAGTARSRRWMIADTALDELAAVTIFDRACAAVYISSETEVAYRPLGLDLLDSLAQATRRVRSRLETQAAATQPHLRTLPPAVADSLVLRAVWPLRPTTDIDDVDRTAAWTPAAQEDLDRLERVLAAPSPADTAAGLRARRGLLTRAQRRAEDVERALTAVTEARTAAEALAAAEAALAAAREGALAATDLPGVGGRLWRAMWTAVEQYSRGEAYLDREFPHVGPDARCPLCAQDLSEAARTRFALLREMVRAELAVATEVARSRLEGLRTSLQSVVAAEEEPLLDELRTTDEEAAAQLTALLTAGATNAGATLRWLDDGVESHLAAIPEGTSRWLRDRAAPIDAELALHQRATTPGELDRVQMDARDLRARKWLADNRDALVGDIGRLGTLRVISAATETCETNQITAESGRLTDRYVTAALRADFSRELDDLNPSRVRVQIIPRGAYGATYHRLELQGGAATARVADVVSDGEFRAVALASFLAELRQSNTQSGVVLDDPVTSLDHLYRERVARRLVAEAGNRQVVIFTHDLVFLHDLTTAAEQTGIPITYRRLRLTSTHVGWPVEEPPWLGMKVRQRVEVLQTELNALRALFDAGDIERYEREARTWYGSLRETWERAVEELLFGDAISRYRHEVKANNLTSERIWILEESDVRQIDAGITNSSAWLRGHDQPAAVNRSVPPPDELRDDLGSLRDWAASLRGRRRVDGGGARAEVRG
jgi:energy-coupling factor transporter ATP-binding protein EcfA2